jgi:hypothetical protein
VELVPYGDRLEFRFAIGRALGWFQMSLADAASALLDAAESHFHGTSAIFIGNLPAAEATVSRRSPDSLGTPARLRPRRAFLLCGPSSRWWGLHGQTLRPARTWANRGPMVAIVVRQVGWHFTRPLPF